MKYIRTKDGRIGKAISVRDYNGHIPTFYHVQFVNDEEIYDDYELEIIAQADTIEELCDEFVLETTINDKLFRTIFREHKTAKMSKYDMFKESWKIFNGYPQEIKDKKIHNYYGAIWTDKGLIFVAKMNDKGVLELL